MFTLKACAPPESTCLEFAKIGDVGVVERDDERKLTLQLRHYTPSNNERVGQSCKEKLAVFVEPWNEKKLHLRVNNVVYEEGETLRLEHNDVIQLCAPGQWKDEMAFVFEERQESNTEDVNNTQIMQRTACRKESTSVEETSHYGQRSEVPEKCATSHNEKVIEVFVENGLALQESDESMMCTPEIALEYIKWQLIYAWQYKCADVGQIEKLYHELSNNSELLERLTQILTSHLLDTKDQSKINTHGALCKQHNTSCYHMYDKSAMQSTEFEATETMEPNTARRDELLKNP